jgi:hypothetical protein
VSSAAFPLEIHSPPIPRLLEPLWLVLGTLIDKKLGQTIEFFREENRILRSKLPERIMLTLRYRSGLMRYDRSLGLSLDDVFTIYSPKQPIVWWRRYCRRTGGLYAPPIQRSKRMVDVNRVSIG